MDHLVCPNTAIYAAPGIHQVPEIGYDTSGGGKGIWCAQIPLCRGDSYPLKDIQCIVQIMWASLPFSDANCLQKAKTARSRIDPFVFFEKQVVPFSHIMSPLQLAS